MSREYSFVRNRSARDCNCPRLHTWTKHVLVTNAWLWIMCLKNAREAGHTRNFCRFAIFLRRAMPSLTWKNVFQELALCNTESRHLPFLQFNHVFWRCAMWSLTLKNALPKHEWCKKEYWPSPFLQFNHVLWHAMQSLSLKNVLHKHASCKTAEWPSPFL